MLRRWDWPQKGGGSVGTGSRKHSPESWAGQDSTAAGPRHYTAVSAGAVKKSEEKYDLLYIIVSLSSRLGSQMVVYYVALRQRMHCHSRRDWVYWTNWRELSRESKHWRLRWKYKKRKRKWKLYCMCSVISFTFTVQWMLCLHVLQLEENSKSWGRQKQEMLTKLSEHRHGFVRTSTVILHNVPSVSWVQLAFVFTWHKLCNSVMKYLTQNDFCFLQRSVSESLYQKSRQRKQKATKWPANELLNHLPVISLCEQTLFPEIVTCFWWREDRQWDEAPQTRIKSHLLDHRGKSFRSNQEKNPTVQQS